MTNEELKILSAKLFPDTLETPEEVFQRYPKRNLSDNAAVTRFAPSPTGFIHFGSLFPVLTSERLAHRSGGVFYLRIEDTDQKREVEGGVQNILDTFNTYSIHFDEGAVLNGDNGNYGPYKQSQRVSIYQTFARELLLMDRAYPCFCTEQELADIHAQQEAEKANFGYYGKWAKWANASLDEIEAQLEAGTPWVLRFRSLGDPSVRFQFRDLIKGTLELPENDQDIVLLKSNGIPTYHFAHIVDDTLMGTTHVVRGDEWLASLPVHLQMFRALGWKIPKYLHISPLMKMDGDSKRKISKRHDPEASMTYFDQEGYPVESVKEYIMTVLNSDFEDWRRQHPDTPLEEFPFSFKKMSPSGALFDGDKLYDVSKNTIARMSAETVCRKLLDWSSKYDLEFHSALRADTGYTEQILAIGRGGKKPRKDIGKWTDAKEYMGFFYDMLFNPNYVFPANLNKADCIAILQQFCDTYDDTLDASSWFASVKALGEKNGFCPDVKSYQKDSTGWKGHVGDVSMILRIAVTGKQTSPDLYTVLQILGKDKVLSRIRSLIAHMN